MCIFAFLLIYIYTYVKFLKYSIIGNTNNIKMILKFVKIEGNIDETISILD